MAPNRDTPVGSYPEATDNIRGNLPRLSMETLQKTVSDVTSELGKVAIREAGGEARPPPPIHELEDARCECCGMSEECTPEYASRVRNKFSGKLVCGLCEEAVRVEMERGGGKSREAALAAHVDACVRFNRIGRAYPALYQAEAMREILKRSSSGGGGGGGSPRVKSISPRDEGGPKKAAIARSSSCIPAIARGTNYGRTTVN